MLKLIYEYSKFKTLYIFQQQCLTEPYHFIYHNECKQIKI